MSLKSEETQPLLNRVDDALISAGFPKYDQDGNDGYALRKGSKGTILVTYVSGIDAIIKQKIIEMRMVLHPLFTIGYGEYTIQIREPLGGLDVQVSKYLWSCGFKSSSEIVGMALGCDRGYEIILHDDGMVEVWYKEQGVSALERMNVKKIYKMALDLAFETVWIPNPVVVPDKSFQNATLLVKGRKPDAEKKASAAGDAVSRD